MFTPGHQQGQHGRINGGSGSRGLQMMYNFQQHQNTNQQQHTQHHPSIQQEHSVHNATGGLLGHHANYSSGMLSSSTPNFTPESVQNGHSATTHRGQAQQVSEHWADQLQLHKESERAHSTMIDQHAPHYFARIKAADNRGISSAIPNAPAATAQDGDSDDRGRPSNIDGAVSRQHWHSMDLSGQGLRVLTPPLFAFTFLNELYIASNKITQIPAAIGQLQHLRHLDASNNLLTELPPEIGICVFLQNLLLFDNSIRILPSELGFLFQLEMLGIEGNPLDAGLKQEIMERGTKALIHHIREQAPVPLPPAPRPLIDLQDGAQSPANEDQLKVFCYNILCDSKYVTSEQYGYIPSGARAWDYRKEQILQEIQAQDADIVCLQEVSTDAFKEFFSVKLAYSDYKGVFWPKTRAKTMSEKDAKVVDGCATFYKGSKYVLLDKQLIDFANIAINRPDMKNQHDIYNRVMPRDDIAVVTFFENRITGTRIIVVNVHLFWNPVFADVKLIQVAILMENINKLAEKYARWPPCTDKKIYGITEDSSPDEPVEPVAEPAPIIDYTNGNQLPLLICSDLNSTADSSVYELLATGRVAPDHMEIRDFQYGNFTRDGIEHPFSLRSAYSHLDGSPDAVTFTNHTPTFSGILDYIWYSTNTLEVLSLLGPVDPEYMKRIPGLPSYHFPSDHLVILAEFSVKGRKEKKNLPKPDFGPSSRNDRRRD